MDMHLVFAASRVRRRSQPRRARFEWLDNRQMLAGQPIISEFAAVNDTGIVDEDGSRSDWIEIYNPTAEPIDLAGWHLSDKSDNLDKWQFPARTLPANGYLVVFASEKDRSSATGELHTNFQLSGDGEFLALTAPDGVTIASQFVPEYPAQVTDVSYGIRTQSAVTQLVSDSASVKVLVPTNGNGGSSLGTAWTGGNEPLNDAAWTAGTNGVGYFTGPGLMAAADLMSRYNFTTNPGTAPGGTIDEAHGAGTGSTAANHGTNTGATWQATEAGSGVGTDQTRSGVLRFDGNVGQQITVPAHSDFNTTTGAITFWVKSAGNVGAGNDGAILLARRDRAGDVIVLSNTGTLFVQATSNYGVVANSFYGERNIADNKWHHVAYVYDQSGTGYQNNPSLPTGCQVNRRIGDCRGDQPRNRASDA